MVDYVARAHPVTMNGNDTLHLVDYLRAIRRRWWLVALLTILTTAAALAVRPHHAEAV